MLNKFSANEASVCVIIVTYNRLEVLKKSLDFARSQDYQPSLIVIVNNNSNDGTGAYLESYNDSTRIKVVNLPHNVGYAGGIARGMSAAGFQGRFNYFWIMDDDSLYNKHALQNLVKNIQIGNFDILGLNEKHGLFSSNILRHSKINPATEHPKEVDSILIDGSLLKSSAAEKIGYPDEKFFMMCEDDEYCFRIKKNGLKVGVIDIGKIDRLQLGGSVKFSKSTLWRGYYQSRNSILILKEYFSFSRLWGCIFRQSKFLIAAIFFAPDRIIRVKFRLKGIWHGLKGIDGKTLDPTSLKFKN